MLVAIKPARDRDAGHVAPLSVRRARDVGALVVDEPQRLCRAIRAATQGIGTGSCGVHWPSLSCGSLRYPVLRPIARSRGTSADLRSGSKRPCRTDLAVHTYLGHVLETESGFKLLILLARPTGIEPVFPP